MRQEHEDRDDVLMYLVETGLTIPGPEREFRLRQLCPEQPHLVREALTRIDWELEMGGFLNEPILRMAQAQDLHPGETLGPQLRVVRKIAEGGMAIVYEAQDERIGSVAIKVPKPAFRRRLLAEARLALQVTHPNICRVHGVEAAQTESGPLEFLTMEYLEGETLQDRVRRDGPLGLREFRELAIQLCAGLAEAHSRGVIHGDLKGNNVILTERDGGLRAVITDFGLARSRSGGGAVMAASVRGTPDFLAPEIWAGGMFSQSSDLYALGVLLYEAATGTRPFAADPDRRKAAPPTPAHRLRKELPRRWSGAATRCLSFDPAGRPKDAASVSKAFQPYWSASPGATTVFVLAALLAGAAGMTVRFPRGPSETLRLAVLPIDADKDAMAWGAGAIRQASLRLTEYRSSNGPVVLMPEPSGAGTDPESSFRNGGATHFLRAHFHSTGGSIKADLIVQDVRSGLNLKTFSGTYSSASIGVLPEALVAAVSSALQLRSAQRAPRIKPNAWADYLKGEGELQKPSPNFEQAIASFQAASQFDPETALPWAGIATALVLEYRSQDDPRLLAMARNATREAESRDPDGIDVHLAAGSVYKESGLPEKAVAEYSRALQLEPGNVDALRRLAGAYSDMELPDQAVQTWQRAISLLPRYYQPYLELGQFYYYQSKYEEAAQQFLKVTQLAPGLAMGHHDLGAAYNDLGRFAEAETSFRKALAIREHSDTLIGLGSVMDYQKRLDEAVSYYERAKQVGPVTYLLLADLGDAYRRVHRAADAHEAYRDALTYADRDLLEKPRNGYIRAFVAYLSARLGDRERAEREVAQALRFDPDQSKVKRTAIRTLVLIGRGDEAHRLLESEPALQAEMKRHPDASEFRTE